MGIKKCENCAGIYEKQSIACAVLMFLQKYRFPDCIRTPGIICSAAVLMIPEEDVFCKRVVIS